VHLTGGCCRCSSARGGAIINVASTAAFQPTPYMATYGATKAFVLHWSLALNEELRGTGVRALAVCPGPTATEFFEARRPGVGLGLARPEHVQRGGRAEKSLRALAAGRAARWSRVGRTK
jgi:short-subunit dehydrogenase